MISNYFNTAYDILLFWVIRMIMMGLYETGKVPFKNVLIHGLVRDAEGVKISKSKGNVVNPMEMVEKYGADALRMGLIWATLVENDTALSEENIKGQRNFANKIWNVARYVFLEKKSKKGERNQDDREIREKLKKTTKKTTRLLEKYKLNEAAETVYSFLWNDFANDYLEKTKSRRQEAQPTLEYILQESLKLIHPFMPFVTEVIWQQEKERFDSPTLISASWPG